MNNFFANWYELLGFFEGFSDDMFDNSLYFPIGLCMVLIPIVLLTMYYYVLNSVKFGKGFYLTTLKEQAQRMALRVAKMFGGISYRNISDLYMDQNTAPSYALGTCCFSFSMINVLWSFVVSFVWSMIIKRGSTNCRRTPF